MLQNVLVMSGHSFYRNLSNREEMFVNDGWYSILLDFRMKKVIRVIML